MKIYINDAKENWIADRFKNEWNKYNQPTRKYPYLLKIILYGLLHLGPGGKF